MSDGLGESSNAPKLKKSEVVFMRAVEQQNLQRVQKLQRTKRSNLITGLSLGTAVIAIYGYSIWSVKQETFLDDFNRPEKIAK